MITLPIPKEPLRVALIGAGVRAKKIYLPLWKALQRWCIPVAICDPVLENRAALASALGVPAYSDIRQLVKDHPMEAAIVVTPIASHHSISVFLSSNGIPNHTETTWASMVCQAKEMIAVARQNNVIVRVAENFFRMPIDRFAQTIRDNGYLGRIGRIFSYADHTGYHNNSRWIVFAQSHPDWVQSIEHNMTHPPFYSEPQRYHDKEALKVRFFHFPNDIVVVDVGSGNVKGHLGRHPRPGYTEWQGERGTLIHRAQGTTWNSELQTQLRYVSDEKFAAGQLASGNLRGGGQADIITQVEPILRNGYWAGEASDTPQGRIAYESPLAEFAGTGGIEGRDWYGLAVMDHIIDFVLAVRGLRASEFTDEDALMSDMMEIGTQESAAQEGQRIRLPIEGELAMDIIEREKQFKQFGVDPLDVEAMLSISFPKP